ncbi:unnamed protein product [Rotaria magnacalcarata]|uniref:Uncharacterized protein n=1 Tax=Rotaria magnacalcarata TaxID=392030 RepID=A0A816TQ45_9BILA|nr:unnamed protein product [Rotaria magnacalcarata]
MDGFRFTDFIPLVPVKSKYNESPVCGDRTDRRETKRCGQSVADKTSHGQIVAGQIVAGQNVVDKTLRTKCRGQIVAKKLSRGQIVAWTNRRMDKLLHGQNVAWTKCCNIAYCYKCLFRG